MMGTVESLKNRCCGCLLCVEICPRNAIDMSHDKQGFLNPVIDRDKCVTCGVCEKSCPIINAELLKSKIVKACAVYNKDPTILENSTSGGAFMALASIILKRDGVVYGASYDTDMLVRHKRVSEFDELVDIQGSKYVQSNISKIFKIFAEDINDNKWVLFSGTPCQIAAIKEFCGFKKLNTDKLLLAEIQCFGVPSPRLWETHLEFLNKQNREVIAYNFRSKRDGWSPKYKALVKYSNGDEEFDTKKLRAYNELYARHLNIRESCYLCPFTDENRVGDITLGDCWQIRDFYPDLDTNRGISQILITQNMSEDILLELFDGYLNEYTLEYTEVVKKDGNLRECVKKPKEYESFWAYQEKHSYYQIIRKYTSYGTWFKVKRKINNALKRFLPR